MILNIIGLYQTLRGLCQCHWTVSKYHRTMSDCYWALILNIGLCQTVKGLCHSVTGLCPTVTELCQIVTGLCQIVTGLSF